MASQDHSSTPETADTLFNIQLLPTAKQPEAIEHITDTCTARTVTHIVRTLRNFEVRWKEQRSLNYIIYISKCAPAGIELNVRCSEILDVSALIDY